MPKVFAKPSLRGELSVGRKMVIMLIGAQICTLGVANVKPDVEVVCSMHSRKARVVLRAVHGMERVVYFNPSYPPNAPLKVRLHIRTLAINCIHF